MIKKSRNGTQFFQFSNLAAFPEISHGVFTRKGGASVGDYNSLNIGALVGDTIENVSKNKEIVLKIIGGKVLVSVNQIHSAEIAQYQGSNHINPLANADAIVTNQEGAALLIQTADCQAVLLYDTIKKVIANIHSGWKGSINNIIANTIDVMTEQYNSNPENIIAGIGPSLGQCCAEFTNYKLEIPEKFWKYKNGKDHFDFWKLSFDQLCQKGILKENIQISKLCTKCNQDLFFSYRRDKVTGRLANIISINQITSE